MFGYDWPRLHAALNDLPTALLVAAVLFDLIAAVTRRPAFRQASLYTLIFGALGGAAAVLSGLQAEEHIEHGDAVHRVMETHEMLAFVTLGIFAVLAVWRFLRENRMGAAERAMTLAVALGERASSWRPACTAGDSSSITPRESPLRCCSRRPRSEPRAIIMRPEKSTSRLRLPRPPLPPRIPPRCRPTWTRPGTPPHTHGEPKSDDHTHAPGTPAHEH